MKTTIRQATVSPEPNEPVTDPKLADELGQAIAEEFEDTENLPIYKLYCRNFPEAVVRRAFNAALTVPPERVKRSRLALFIYLIKKYANKKD